MEIEIKKGSVVKSEAEVIVNAANENLACGGGVCGAIFEAAGVSELTRECKAIAPIKTGRAVMTNGYNLKAKKIIHAVGPIYRGKLEDEKLLAEAYYNSLVLADSNGYKSIGFPSISTGIFGFPLTRASKIAIKVIKEFKGINIKKVYLHMFKDEEYEVFSLALKEYKE